MTNPSPDERLKAFGEQLRRRRVQAGYINGKDFAAVLDWSQSKVSRIETGKTTIAAPDLAEWCKATDTSDADTAALLDELREIQIERASWPRQLRKGHRDRQVEAARTEKRSGHIRAFEMALIPGLVQTPDYARYALTRHAELHGATTDVQRAVAIRMERQQVLYDETKSIELLITEPVLEYAICPPRTMLAQIDRLISMVRLEHLRFGIIPLYTTLPVIPMHGFWIFDNSVIIETNDSEIKEETPDDIGLYNRIMDQLWTVAVTGDDVRAILLRSAERWADIVKGNENA